MYRAGILLSLFSNLLLGASLTHIEWNPVRGAKQYEVEITGALFQRPIEKVPGTVPGWEGRLEPGSYSFRVRALGRDNHLGEWSQPERFVVQTRADHFSAGLSAGSGFYFPELHLERKIGGAFTLGLMPVYLQANELFTSVYAYGGLLTFDYYLGDVLFLGLGVEVGAGAYYITEPQYSLSATPAVLTTLVRWRQEIVFGLDFGLAAGAEFLLGPKKAPSWVIQTSGVFPMIQVEVGTDF